MVPGEGEHTDRVDRDRLVAELVGDDDRLALHPVGAEDRDLGLVDDGELHHRAVLARVGEGEGAATEVVGRQLLGTGAVGDVLDVAGDLAESFSVDPLHHRCEQTFEVVISKHL